MGVKDVKRGNYPVLDFLIYFSCMLILIFGTIIFLAWGVPTLTNSIEGLFYLRTTVAPFNNPFSYDYFLENCDYLGIGFGETSEFYVTDSHGLFSNGIFLKKDWNLVETRGNWSCLKRLK
jgi:hypothetical protein